MAVRIDLGKLRQVATLSAPPALPGTPDGLGGYTLVPVPLNPATWRCSIEKVTLKNAESHFSAATIALATHMLSGRYHSGLTTRTTVVWTDRGGTVHTASVLDVDDTEGLGVESVILVSEIAA